MTENVLSPKYIKAKSFYGKAKVVEEFGTKSLISYKSCICQIRTVGLNTEVIIYDVHDYHGNSLTFSRTSLKHLREFLLQNDFEAENKADILKRYTVVDGGNTDAL